MLISNADTKMKCKSADSSEVVKHPAKARAMDEKHENEQYFFDKETTAHLANFARVPEPLLSLRTTLGQELERLGVASRILDIDARFATLRGFLHYDVTRPRWLGESFGLILFDPPFFNAAPVSQFVETIRMLAKYQTDQKLLISWPVRRSKKLLESFSQFGLKATGYRPGYESVPTKGRTPSSSTAILEISTIIDRASRREAALQARLALSWPPYVKQKKREEEINLMQEARWQRDLQTVGRPQACESTPESATHPRPRPLEKNFLGF